MERTDTVRSPHDDHDDDNSEADEVASAVTLTASQADFLDAAEAAAMAAKDKDLTTYDSDDDEVAPFDASYDEEGHFDDSFDERDQDEEENPMGLRVTPASESALMSSENIAGMSPKMRNLMKVAMDVKAEMLEKEREASLQSKELHYTKLHLNWLLAKRAKHSKRVEGLKTALDKSDVVSSKMRDQIALLRQENEALKVEQAKAVAAAAAEVAAKLKTKDDECVDLKEKNAGLEKVIASLKTYSTERIGMYIAKYEAEVEARVAAEDEKASLYTANKFLQEEDRRRDSAVEGVLQSLAYARNQLGHDPSVKRHLDNIRVSLRPLKRIALIPPPRK